MGRIPNVFGLSLVPFVCDVVEKENSAIFSDYQGSYNELARYGCPNDKGIFSITDDTPHISMPCNPGTEALHKQRLLSTNQGSVSAKHLNYHLG